MSLLAVLAVVGVALAAAATAYACTAIRGQTYVNRSSGTPGTGIGVWATGARPSTYHYVHFLNFRVQQDAMRTCMAGRGVSHPDIRRTGALLASSTGAIATRTVAIPTDVHTSTSVNHPAHRTSSSTGPALFCHITNGYGYATRSASVTVL